MVTRRARNRPWASSAISAVVRLSRPCASPRKCSVRSAAHFTGTPRRCAAMATRGYSRYAKIFVPKPPPTSGVTTRSRSFGQPSTPATTSRTSWLPCEPSVSMIRLVCGSTSARQARGSMKFATTRLFTRSSETVRAAVANTASVAAASPTAASNAQLVPICGHTTGASLRCACAIPTVASSGS